MNPETQSNVVSVVVLRSWPVRAGDWRAQFQVEASRVRGEIAVPAPLSEGQRLQVRPANRGWSLAGVAERP